MKTQILKFVILIILLNFKIFSQEEDVKELKEKDENLKKQIYQLEEEQKKINQKIQEIDCLLYTSYILWSSALSFHVD